MTAAIHAMEIKIVAAMLAKGWPIISEIPVMLMSGRMSATKDRAAIRPQFNLIDIFIPLFVTFHACMFKINAASYKNLNELLKFS